MSNFDEDELELEGGDLTDPPTDEAILRVNWMDGQVDTFGVVGVRLRETGVLQALLHDGTVVTLSPSTEWGIKDPEGEVTDL